MPPPRPGEPVPPFSFEKLLQAPDGTPLRLEDFLGSVVVLEFWTTTCRPCVDAIPHLNELVAAARDRPIRFLAVTPETECIVAAFLRRQRFDCWIALDGVGVCARDWFGIHGVPTVILIARDGRVAAVTHPHHLRWEHLLEVVETGHSSLPEPAVREKRRAEASPPLDPAPLFGVSISASRRQSEPTTPFNSWRISDNRCLCIGHRADLQSAIREIFGLEAGQLKSELDWPAGDYSFLLHGPPGSAAALRQAFAAALQACFGLCLNPIELECEVAVLTTSGTTGPGLRPAHPLSRGGGGEYRGQLILNGAPWGALKKYLVKWLAVPVIDETGFTGCYDLRMKWKLSAADLLLTEVDPDPAEICRSLERDLGLRLNRARRILPGYVVRSTNPESQDFQAPAFKAD